MGAGALVVMAVTRHTARERAIATARQYGQVAYRVPLEPYPTVQRFVHISLRDQRGFDEVIPLLKDIRELRQLWLGGTGELRAEHLRTIGELDQLYALAIQGCGIADDDLEFLKDLPNLHELSITRTAITDAGLRHLRSLQNLEKLDLRMTQVTGSGLVFVTPALQELSLGRCPVDDESVAHCTRFQRLRSLSFPDTHVTENGLMKLTSLHWLRELATPNEMPRDNLRRFRLEYLKSLDTAAAAGQEVPPKQWRLGPYE
jgi:hypothetical protein